MGNHTACEHLLGPWNPISDSSLRRDSTEWQGMNYGWFRGAFYRPCNLTQIMEIAIENYVT